MRTTTTYGAQAVPALGQATRAWLEGALRVAKAAAVAAGAALYRITKARILLEHDPGRPARRL